MDAPSMRLVGGLGFYELLLLLAPVMWSRGEAYILLACALSIFSKHLKPKPTAVA
jgi:hypothetical protein